MIALHPARAARLFADIEAQQKQLLRTQRPAPLPPCPNCSFRSYEIVHRADGRSLTFMDCGHVFSLSSTALLAGLRERLAA